MLKFDWLRAGPYACVRTGVWTGWTSVHNNKGKHWLFVVLLVWVYNKALINLEFSPYGKYLLWRHAALTSLRSVRTAWRHNKYFRVWTALSVNKSILLSNFQENSKNISTELQKYQPILPYFFSRQSSEFLPPVQNITNMIIVRNLNFWEVQNFYPHRKCSNFDDSCKILLLEKFWFISLISTPLIFTPLIFRFCDLIINILLGTFS